MKAFNKKRKPKHEVKVSVNINRFKVLRYHNTKKIQCDHYYHPRYKYQSRFYKLY